MAGKSFAVFLQTDFDKPCRVRALSFYLRIPIGQTDLFPGTAQVKAIVEGSLDQRRIPNNLDTEDSNAALHPFIELKATHISAANLIFTSNCFKTRRLDTYTPKKLNGIVNRKSNPFVRVLTPKNRNT